MTYPTKYGVFYDFRNPGNEPWDRRYAQLLEQIRWVDAAGTFDGVSLTEHHFVGDGYSPSTMSLATAVAAITSRVQITTNIVQLPLHHPLRIAEDALTADIVSGGRFRLGLAGGYRKLEFEAFGVSTRERATRMEEGVEIIRRAFSGEEFSFSGVHWDLPAVRVTPGPIRPGGPEIWLGGTSGPAIERAARLADGFLASQDHHGEEFLAAAARLGRPELAGRTVRTARLLVAPDPERAVYELGDCLLHQVNQYVEFGFIDGPRFTDAGAAVRAGHYAVVDADGAVAALARAGEAGVAEFHLMAVLPGEPVESGTRRLEYVISDVLPRVRTHEGVTTR
jgi:alkanesulfonate monooxygenase SsuD/methylene tetrahydromethanopterin reductase-like flavin-dependent oxidoreductase (luciferase family)